MDPGTQRLKTIDEIHPQVFQSVTVACHCEIDELTLPSAVETSVPCEFLTVKLKVTFTIVADNSVISAAPWPGTGINVRFACHRVSCRCIIVRLGSFFFIFSCIPPG